MVTDTVLGAAIGVSGAVIGSLLTGAFNWLATKQRVAVERENLRIQQESETERRRGEYYLDQKVESLMTLYAVLEEARREYKKTADKAVYEEISQDEYETVIKTYREYERTMDRAAVFLSEPEHETLLAVFDTLHETNQFLTGQIENPEQVSYSEFGLSEYNSAFNDAEQMLKDEIKGPIEAMETGTLGGSVSGE